MTCFVIKLSSVHKITVFLQYEEGKAMKFMKVEMKDRLVVHEK